MRLTAEAAEESLERDSDTEEGGGLGGADTARLYDIILGAEVTAAGPSTGRGTGWGCKTYLSLYD